MTKREMAVAMWQQDVPIRKIAQELGVKPATVYGYLYRHKGMEDRAREAEERKERVRSGVCPYSDDCFRCPMPDCVVGQPTAMRVNQLESDKRGWGYGTSEHSEAEG